MGDVTGCDLCSPNGRHVTDPRFPMLALLGLAGLLHHVGDASATWDSFYIKGKPCGI